MKVIKYDKLIRDKIPEIIEKAGKTCKTKTLNNEELVEYLLKKLHEEVKEFEEAKSAEEMADVLEVINALIKNLNLDKNDIEEIRLKKLEKNGGFDKKLVLLEVDEN